jgi:hypothetical protein
MATIPSIKHNSTFEKRENATVYLAQHSSEED